MIKYCLTMWKSQKFISGITQIKQKTSKKEGRIIHIFVYYL